MHEEDYFIEHDLPIQWGYRPIPLCSLKMNVPRIPKHSEPSNMARLPSYIQTCRKVLHLEVDKQDIDLVTHIVKFAKPLPPVVGYTCPPNGGCRLAIYTRRYPPGG
jgi:hypothetical protein